MASTTRRQARGPKREGAAESDDAAGAIVNEVRLHGRWQGAVERELPSGDLLVTARVVVARPEGGVDALDCAVWPAGLRRRVLGWPDGTHVEVAGSLRRRFFRTPVGAASRYEVQVERIRRAPRSPGRRPATV
ncbi:MAG: single-stranded DNA-binding protein [Angustibacter sp.]